MGQNLYTSPEPVQVEKPVVVDERPPLPLWRMRLGMACYVVGVPIAIYGAVAWWPPFHLPFGESLAVGGALILEGRILRRHRPLWPRGPDASAAQAAQNRLPPLPEAEPNNAAPPSEPDAEPNNAAPSEPRRELPRGPMTVFGALKCIFWGGIFSVVGFLAFRAPAVHINFIVFCLLGAPIAVWFGVVSLLLPTRLLGSKLHDDLNKAGTIGWLLIALAGTVWYLWPILTGHKLF